MDNNMILTAALPLDYALPAAAHSAVGFGRSNRKAQELCANMVHGFFYAPRLWRGVLGSRKACRFLSLSTNPIHPAARYLVVPVGGFFTDRKELSINTQSQVTPEFRPHVVIINGQIKTSSLKIAEHFKKRHDSVLLKVKNLECSDDFRLHNFMESSYVNEQNKEQPCYELTRDGFTFLAMGFTGKQAAQWKEAYILAFNRMESELQSKPQPQPNLPPTQYPFDGRLLLTIRNGNVTETQVLDRHDVLFTPDTAPSIRKWIMDYIPARNLSLVIEVATQRVLAISSASRG